MGKEEGKEGGRVEGEREGERERVRGKEQACLQGFFIWRTDTKAGRSGRWVVDVPEAQMVSGNSLKKMKTHSPSTTCVGHNAASADDFFRLPGGCDWKHRQ